MKIQEIKQYALWLADTYNSQADPEDKTCFKNQARGLSGESRKFLIKIIQNPNKTPNAEKLNKLNDELTHVTDANYTFEDPGFFTNMWHAVEHFFGKRIYATEFLDKINEIASQGAFCAKSATYETDGSGIDDISYVDPVVGFGYVVDGTGHNNPMMATVLNRIFSGFNEGYKEYIEENNPQTVEEYTQVIKDALTTLGNAIHEEEEPVQEENPNQDGFTKMNEGTLKPALSFAQIAKVDEERKLISAQFCDTILLIKKADGSFDTSLAVKRPDFGIGAPERKLTKEGVVQVTDIQKDDVVYGFSDGIGEFLSMAELQTIISENVYPPLLLDELKEAIIAKGLDFVLDEDGRKQRVETSANQMGVIKYHDPENAKNHDDISFFMLKVT